MQIECKTLAPVYCKDKKLIVIRKTLENKIKIEVFAYFIWFLKIYFCNAFNIHLENHLLWCLNHSCFLVTVKVIVYICL